MMLEAALDYARRGWAVFPCHSSRDGRCSCGRPDCESPAKHPRTARGLKDATTDADQIAQHWSRWRDANSAIATGWPFVLDIDGLEGALTLEGLQTANQCLPETLSVRTGRGWQMYFRAEQLCNSARKLGRQLDTRGAGGYVIAPPSLHITGHRYRWLNPDAPIADLPPWLYRLLERPRPAPRTESSVPEKPSDRYVRAALEREAREVSATGEGARNHRLNAAAFALARFDAQLLSDEQIFSALMPAARSAGLTSTESARTIMSGLRARRRSA
jgi:hypothetical protein